MSEQARGIKRKAEEDGGSRSGFSGFKEALLDEPYLHAARQYGCFCGVLVPSKIKRDNDVWDLLPQGLLARKIPAKSHKRKLKPATPVEPSSTRLLYFAMFFAQEAIPPGIVSVGFPGDLWVTDRTVQVFGQQGWIDWGPDSAPNGGFEHPFVSGTLGWKANEHRLGYAGQKASSDIWEETWARDVTLAHVQTGFQRRIPSHAIAAAVSRVRELCTVTDVVTGQQILVRWKDMTQEALAALLFPLHDPSLSEVATCSPQQPHASQPGTSSLSTAPGDSTSALTQSAVTAPTAPPAPGDSTSALTQSAVTAPTAPPAPGDSTSALTQSAVTAPTTPPSPLLQQSESVSAARPFAAAVAPGHSRSLSEKSALSELPPGSDENVYPSDLPPGFNVEMLKGLPATAFLRFTTGQTEILPPFMHDPEDADGRMAREMGKGQDGYRPLPESNHEVHLRSSDAPFVKLRREQFRDKGSSDIEIAADVMKHLQVGQVVVMDGCDYPDLPWGLRTFADLSGGDTRDGEYSLQGEIEWQSAALRILSRADLRNEFTVVGTWLDFTRVASPRLLGDVPEGGDTSFEAPVNLLDLATSMDTTASAPFLRRLRDDVKADDMLSRRLRHADTFHVDKKKSKGWVLVSGAGYQSYTHVDGSGECTFFMLTHGRKWWAVLKMKRGCNNPKKVQKARQKMKEEFEHYLRIAKVSNDYNEVPVEIPGLATIHSVLLEPGMLLIQPPGVFHAVYTPVPSIGIGGHFFTQDTLHLTLQCRLVIQRSRGQGTNAFHPDANRSLARILLALIERGDTKMNQRGFISLARMLKQRKTHFSVVDFVKDLTTDDDLTYDDTEFEIDLACDLIDMILAHNSLEWEDLKLNAKAPL
ncbi:hypothetical protein PsYK624_168500 [Phanerochaete sordida]|uniref:JmjC domain-containing protein n=1 Tax=Phanerochaete sordida TaxID=48140 RepID=A0A9P3LMH0_9APHY|nr:hypothetical protein PsYK624_168500 [Phanerochaete sordida]